MGDNMSGLTVELVVSKSVRDTAAILEAVHGPAPGDPYVAPAPVRPYTDELGADPGRLRIGLLTDPMTGDQPDPPVLAAVREAAELLESLGHDLEETSLGGLESIDLVETFLVRWSAGQAAALSQLGTVTGAEITAEDVEPLTWALAEKGRSHSAGEYLEAVGLHQAMGRMVAGLHEGGIDLFLSPTLAEVPPPLGTFDDSGPDPLAAIHRATKTCGFVGGLNATGQPAVSLPLCVSEEGLPIGIQLAAPFGREDLLIQVAAQLEEARPWADRRPETLVA
jgi:amidase